MNISQACNNLKNKIVFLLLLPVAFTCLSAQLRTSDGWKPNFYGSQDQVGAAAFGGVLWGAGGVVALERQAYHNYRHHFEDKKHLRIAKTYGRLACVSFIPITGFFVVVPIVIVMKNRRYNGLEDPTKKHVLDVLVDVVSAPVVVMTWWPLLLAEKSLNVIEKILASKKNDG